MFSVKCYIETSAIDSKAKKLSKLWNFEQMLKITISLRISSYALQSDNYECPSLHLFILCSRLTWLMDLSFQFSFVTRRKRKRTKRGWRFPIPITTDRVTMKTHTKAHSSRSSDTTGLRWVGDSGNFLNYFWDAYRKLVGGLKWNLFNWKTSVELVGEC